MADITDQHDQTSPADLDDAQGNGNSAAVAAESRGVKRQRPSTADDDDDDDEKGGRERRKIEIKFISDKSRRHITFSKRKAGIMKKVCRVPLALPAQKCISLIIYPHLATRIYRFVHLLLCFPFAPIATCALLFPRAFQHQSVLNRANC